MSETKIYIFIGIALLVCALFIFPGCVSIKTHERGVDEARVETFQKARKIAKGYGCKEAAEVISNRIETLGGEF